MAGLGWTDAERLSELLLARFPAIDPLTVRFPDLMRWVTELDGFAGSARPPSWDRLEDVQRAWYARYDAGRSPSSPPPPS